MKTIVTEFDDVVYSTDPDLRHRYQKQAGMKKGLPFILEEYRKLAASTPWGLYPREMFAVCLAGLVTVGAIMVAFIRSGAVDVHGWLTVTMVGFLMVTVTMSVTFMFYESKDSQRRSAMNERYEVLKNFADAVGFDLAFTSPPTSRRWRFTSEIEPSLVRVGQEIIRSERHFDALCNRRHSSRDDIVAEGLKLQRLGRDLEQGLRRAELFGVKFERAHVMVEAQKVLDRAK